MPVDDDGAAVAGTEAKRRERRAYFRENYRESVERFKRSNLRFKCHDVMRVHELGETFDAAAMLDAECYLPDKRLAVERIAQIVNPGGRFLLLAWCKREGLGKLQHELVLHPLMRYWGIPGLE